MIHKVLIVDDHLIVREGLKLILETNEAYQVIGEAEDGETALRLAEQLSPDAILMDLNLPGMSGLEAIASLRERQPEIPVIILTTYNEDDLMKKGLALGAKGYLLKDTGRDDLFRTIEAAIRGETLLQSEVTARVFAAQASHPDPAVRFEKPVLTDKERMVLQAVARGFRSKEIAFDMGISERTVKAHLTNIYNKLGVDSRSQAVAVAVELGLLYL
ncbi:response regulator [Paenibacillus durus]|uniref:Chemotaxis protein CheY n=1 Tax=Paenibacillus durus TaxID=44251 RepID=A0A089HK59_PAEDU|nr:response regulator transcription factor [Paenibacillus durus]AIQ12341.1 chemotaxis protein CheY [Paenibacillus durus]